jgi:hypothetical protein
MSASPNPSPSPNFTIITADDPETILSTLPTKRTATFLIIRRSVRFSSNFSYYIERVHSHRNLLLISYHMEGRKIQYNGWYYHGGLYWPGDLGKLPGPWKNPFTFTFPRLMLLDLDIHDAVYWLMPILQATKTYALLRHVILRGCIDYDDHAIPFPFQAFNAQLEHWPDAKVLLAWAQSDREQWIQDWRKSLPRLESAGRIGLLYSAGPKCM